MNGFQMFCRLAVALMLGLIGKGRGQSRLWATVHRWLFLMFVALFLVAITERTMGLETAPWRYAMAAVSVGVFAVWQLIRCAGQVQNPSGRSSGD